jgi:hypothetical protein
MADFFSPVNFFAVGVYAFFGGGSSKKHSEILIDHRQSSYQ